jgi:hypothetical protein
MAQANPSAPNETSQPYVDPTFSLINTSCLDLLLIELVPMAYRITADLAAREEEWIHGSSASPAARPKRLSGSTSNDAASTVAGGTTRGGGTDAGGHAGGAATVDEEESREAVFHRLEALGYRVGLGVVERYVSFSLSSLLPCVFSWASNTQNLT